MKTVDLRADAAKMKQEMLEDEPIQSLSQTSDQAYGLQSRDQNRGNTSAANRSTKLSPSRFTQVERISVDVKLPSQQTSREHDTVSTKPKLS